MSAPGAQVTEVPRPLRIPPVWIGLIAVCAAAITAAVTAAGARATTGASGGAALAEALARAVIVAVPIAIALWACRRPAHARFSRSLLVLSALWFLASLSTSSSPFLFTVGRVGGWLTDTGLVYVLLAFPEGHLESNLDRVLWAISIVVVLTLYLPTLLLVTHFPDPSAYTNCTTGCPANDFMLTAHQPAFIDSFVNPLREGLVIVVFAVVAARLGDRIRSAKPLMRRILAPVLGVAIVRLVAYIAALVARRAAPDSSSVQVAAWIVAFAVPALALAFLLGLARWHLFVAAAVRKVNAQLRQMPGPEQVRDLLAAAFQDQRLNIGSWSPGRERWVDPQGSDLRQPPAGSGYYLTRAGDVAILHDVALRDDPAFVDVAAAAVSVAFASERAAARTHLVVEELRQSRARILAAADDERRRIERDLHDGAQQRLVALCIHLELSAERAETENDPEEAAALRGLVREVQEALEEMRSLTHDIYPATLLERGLDAAIRSAALRSPVPTTVTIDGLGEYPREISAAVYFCCVEALQNVAKHARQARSVQVVLRETADVLYFSVTDDGPGLGDRRTRVGAGLINMQDRITTVGGKVTVRSRPGEGTRVNGRVPLSAIDRGSDRRDTAPFPRGSRTSRRRDRSDT